MKPSKRVKNMISIVTDAESTQSKLIKFNNRVYTSIKKIQDYIKKHNLAEGKQVNGLTACIIYRDHMEYDAILGKKTYRKWAYSLFFDGEDENIKKVGGDGFYSSVAWLKLKKDVFFMYGKKCMKCSSTKNIAVDHIKPRSIYPELSLDINNMQVLCRSCNSSKSTKTTDYRKLSFSSYQSHQKDISRKAYFQKKFSKI